MKIILLSWVLIIVSIGCSDGSREIKYKRPDGNGYYVPSEVVLSHIREKQIVFAIKQIRSETDLGLSDANKLLEDINCKKVDGISSEIKNKSFGVMNEEIKKSILASFSEEEWEVALSEMESLTLKHVMADSQTNLDNTWLAILKLSNGDLEKLKEMVEAAKLDFRDVIYWASLES